MLVLHFTIGSQTPPNNTRHIMDTHIHHLHTFLHTVSGLYNPLQQPRIVSRPHILYNISTTLYTPQLYSISTVYNLYNTPLHTQQRRHSRQSAFRSLLFYPVGVSESRRETEFFPS